VTTPDEPEPMNSLASTDQVSDGLDKLQGEACEWIVRYMSGRMTPADLAAMQAWYCRSEAHASAYAEARRLWKELGPIAAAREQALAREQRVARVSTALSVPVGRRIVLGGAIAASAAYVVARPPLGLWPSYAEWSADYRTGTGEQRQVTLAQSVSLDLNTRTSIAIRSQAADAAHVEVIAGEAVIATRAGAMSLTVLAGSGRVVSTRAEFDLRCDDGRVAVTCLRGDVTVKRSDASTLLHANQQVSYSDREIGAVATVDPEIVTAWRKGLLIFEAAPLADVIAEINRYRPGRIVLLNDDLGRRRLTARLKTAETDVIVDQIERIFAAKVRRLPGGIVLLS
jgi:transmembrane sensor